MFSLPNYEQFLEGWFSGCVLILNPNNRPCVVFSLEKISMMSSVRFGTLFRVIGENAQALAPLKQHIETDHPEVGITIEDPIIHHTGAGKTGGFPYGLGA